MVDTLHLLPPDQTGTEEIRERLEALIYGLARNEQAAGRWSTVVDRHETYLESSVSAFAALGIERAIRWEMVSAEYSGLVQRALRATLGQLSPHGELLGVSDATPVGADAGHCAARPLGSHPWGQGPALLAAIEVAPILTR